ncbi:bacillithiol biosynthesis cysteine-adding enzyme BshC [Bacillus sp. JJ1764]|uniref:bacillithiol biosynthesis cysteine-adding enzyme BshC n=1 Tax=Bacillus sp. JJ1764 TaxID=3122964 RepID=UPI002FFF18BF
MEMLNLSLPATNRFASNYLEQSSDIMPFFHYRYNDEHEDQNRLAELKERRFLREQVANHIERFMQKFPSSIEVEHSIRKLKNENSVVVIGGQQAGILTGPLYSIHKVISIIKLAQQKEQQLGVPVIPVFWIAGEDHDYQEVNHVFVPVGEKADKWIYPEKVLQKKMVSDIEIDRNICREWVYNLVENLGETEYTNQLLEFSHVLIEKSTTFVDFFAGIVMELFKDYGLLVVDSGNSEFRQLQKEFLMEQINNHQGITLTLLEQQQQIREKGFPTTIEATEQSANLFFYDQIRNERILLEYDNEDHHFVGKNGTVSFTKEELVEIVANHPEKLSNNVVTRPLMQEWLFPTIAFIAGPGEIAYWAELKLVFESFNIKMPPIVPRLNITLLDRSIEGELEEIQLSLDHVLQQGTTGKREQFLASIKDHEIDDLFQVMKDQLKEQYRLVEAKTSEIERGLIPLVRKNESFLLKDLNFMQTKLQDAVTKKHDIRLKKFTRIDLALRPNGIPQERVWNIYYYLNHYGLDIINRIMALSFEFDGTHKVIKL